MGINMTGEPVNIYKQIILHILHRASCALTQGTVLDVITALNYTDYIHAQSALGDLIESGLVTEKNTYRHSYVTLTETGEQTRLAFEDDLSQDIRREVDEYLKKNHVETLDETSLVSDYKMTKDGMYTATCSLRDGAHVLYEINLEVASEEDAIRICNSWESKSEELYSHALKSLLV
jgi:predicted transcriptional regulator